MKLNLLKITYSFWFLYNTQKIFRPLRTTYLFHNFIQVILQSNYFFLNLPRIYFGVRHEVNYKFLSLLECYLQHVKKTETKSKTLCILSITELSILFCWSLMTMNIFFINIVNIKNNRELQEALLLHLGKVKVSIMILQLLKVLEIMANVLTYEAEPVV